MVAPAGRSGTVVEERNLTDLYVELKPSLYGAALLGLCILVGVVEGYDVQAMSLAAPLLAKAWHLAPPQVGAMLAISLIGQTIGGFLLAPLGDRFGRRTAMLSGLLIAGLATLSGAYASTYGIMLVARFVAGLGLGLALANTVILALELVPISWRTIAIILVYSGYPLGAATGAAVVGHLLPTLGVAAVFYVGGIGTMVALLICLIALPESPVILVRRSEDQSRVRRMFAKLGVAVAASTRLVVQDRAGSRSNVAALFTPERRTATLLLWLLMFANLSLVYFFVMWLPSIFVQSGLDPRAAIKSTALFSFSGIAGGLVMASLLPRIGPVRTLGICYVATIVALAVFASIRGVGPSFYLTLFCCGFLIIGSQFSLGAIASLFYPGEIRATGSGFALGAGRFGGVFAPIAGGFVLAHVSTAQAAFYVGLVPAGISLLALLGLRRFSLVGLHAE